MFIIRNGQYHLIKFSTEGWSLNKSLPVMVKDAHDGSGVTLLDRVFGEYGTGKTLDEALTNFELSFVELYLLLERSTTSKFSHLALESLFFKLKEYISSP